jgi:hypothetical protein
MAVATPSAVDLGAALCAAGPHPDHADALMLFGRLVGAWDFDWACYGADGDQQTLTDAGEWIFGWVLEGRAVQDVWIIPSRERRGVAGAPAGEYGTTLRWYDPRLDAWLVTWNGPINRARRMFIGREVGGEIVQEGQTEEGYPLRWIFSELEERSFHWSSLYSTDGEQTWLLREEMEVRRKTG